MASIIFFIPVNNASFKKYRDCAIDGLISCFTKSKNFRTTNAIAKTLLEITQFNDSQLQSIIEAIKTNVKIGNEKNRVPLLKRSLHNTYGINLDI